MENNDRINFEFFTALYSSESEEELRKKFKEIIVKARDFEKDNLRRDVERSMEIIRQMEDLDEEDFKLFASMQYFNKMDDAGKFCHEDLQFEAPSPMDMSIHIHLLVDVAMEERDYHDALVVRRFLERKIERGFFEGRVKRGKQGETRESDAAELRRTQPLGDRIILII